MRVEQISVGAFQENCYLLSDESGHVVLIDPGAESERLIAAVRRTRAPLEAIWLTHAHLDHVGAIAGLKRVWPESPVYLHPLERPLYDRADLQAAAYGLPFEEPPPPDKALADGDTLRVGELAFSVMHAPGHAPGLVVIHGHGVAFVGDLLFAGSIGRTDLPLSDPVAMAASLERVRSLPAQTVIYPGHGPASTIGRELESNPFLNGLARVIGG